MAVSKRLRFEIMRRDNHACRYCGAKAPDVELTIDHIVPVSLGGADDATNLVTACADCNSGKSSTPADAAVIADVEQDTMRWAAAMKRAADIDRTEKDRIAEQRGAVWEHWTTYNNQWAWPPAGWQTTVDQFLAAGLSVDDILDCADIAMDTYGVTQRNRWRYFCGVAWRTIERRQQAARAILDGEGDATDAT